MACAVVRSGTLLAPSCHRWRHAMEVVVMKNTNQMSGVPVSNWPTAVINAMVEAVSHLGVTEIGKPATPERVWKAIRDARGGAA